MCKRSVPCLLQPCHRGPRTPNACLARCPCALVPEISRMTQTTTMMVGCCKWAASLQLYELDSHPRSWPCRLAVGCKFGADCLQKAACASSVCGFEHPLCRPVAAQCTQSPLGPAKLSLVPSAQHLLWRGRFAHSLGVLSWPLLQSKLAVIDMRKTLLLGGGCPGILPWGVTPHLQANRGSHLYEAWCIWGSRSHVPDFALSSRGLHLVILPLCCLRGA